MDEVQLELALGEVPGSLDSLTVRAVLAKDRPEVGYQVHYTPIGCKQQMDRVWLDSLWPIERMIPLIIAMLADHMAGVRWTKTEVQRVLNAVHRTYGCQEPF